MNRGLSKKLDAEAEDLCAVASEVEQALESSDDLARIAEALRIHAAVAALVAHKEEDMRAHIKGAGSACTPCTLLLCWQRAWGGLRAPRTQDALWAALRYAPAFPHPRRCCSA